MTRHPIAQIALNENLKSQEIRPHCRHFLRNRLLHSPPFAGAAAALRGPKHIVKTGKTPVLEADAWRKLLNSIADDRKSWLFRTARGHNGKVLSAKPMTQPDAWRMIRRRAAAAGIAEAIGCHTFRNASLLVIHGSI
jgi:hypothetical protein